MQPELPRTAVWISRVQLAAAALALLVGVVGGIGMQIEQLGPGALWDQATYQRMLGFHWLAPLAIGVPALAGGFGYLAVCRLAGVSRVAAPAVAWVAFGLWVIGAVATAIAIEPAFDSGWTLYTPQSLGGPPSRWPMLAGPIALACAGLLYAGHLGVVIVMSISSARTPQLVAAFVFVLAIALVCIQVLITAVTVVAIRDPLAIHLLGSHPHATTLAAAITLATVAIAGDRGWPLALTAIGFGAVSAFASFALLPLGIAGLWIALAIVNGFGRPAVAAILFGAVPALILYGIAPWLGGDLHVHDTYIETGRYHLAAAIVVFAGLATLLVRTHAHPKLSWVGTWLCGAGVVLHGAATLYVGASGMPRRYWQYDPALQSGHLLAGVGGAVIVGGMIVLAIAWLRGSRSK